MPSCEVTVASIEPTGSLVMYSDSGYTTSSAIFYIDDEAWGRISIDALQDIDSVAIDSLTIKQDGIVQDLQTSTFEYQEVARTTGDVATVDFKCRLAISELKGELSGKSTDITADLTLTYVDGTRRRLQVTIDDNDVPTDTRAESTIVLLKGPCDLPAGRLHETIINPCPESTREQIVVCEVSGWNTLVQCPSSSPVVENSQTTSESSFDSPWLFATLCLTLLLALGCVVYSKCSTPKKDTFTLTSIKIAS